MVSRAMNTMFYSDGTTELQLGDRVLVSRFLRKPLDGVVCYVPGYSKVHEEMAIDGLEFWAVSLDDGRVLAWPFLPGKRVKSSITFVRRGDVGDKLLKPGTTLS